jgi:nitrile hydratase accessory protein
MNKPSGELSRLRELGSLPRQNGEVIFEAPWQSRTFGLVAGLTHVGVCDWGEFQGRISAVAVRDETWDDLSVGESPHQVEKYYERWVSALEQILISQGTITHDDLDRRVATLRAHNDHTH